MTYLQNAVNSQESCAIIRGFVGERSVLLGSRVKKLAANVKGK